MAHFIFWRMLAMHFFLLDAVAENCRTYTCTAENWHFFTRSISKGNPSDTSLFSAHIVKGYQEHSLGFNMVLLIQIKDLLYKQRQFNENSYDRQGKGLLRYIWRASGFPPPLGPCNTTCISTLYVVQPAPPCTHPEQAVSIPS